MCQGQIMIQPVPLEALHQNGPPGCNPTPTGTRGRVSSTEIIRPVLGHVLNQHSEYLVPDLWPLDHHPANHPFSKVRKARAYKLPRLPLQLYLEIVTSGR